jgi:hypothetical protein
MTHLLVLTAGALLPALFALGDISEHWIWRVSSVLLALPMLALLLTYPYRRRKTIGKNPPPAIFAVFVIFGSAAIMAMLFVVWSDTRYDAASYAAALTVNFFTTAYAFVMALDVIMQQPIES